MNNLIRRVVKALEDLLGHCQRNVNNYNIVNFVNLKGYAVVVYFLRIDIVI